MTPRALRDQELIRQVRPDWPERKPEKFDLLGLSIWLILAFVIGFGIYMSYPRTAKAGEPLKYEAVLRKPAKLKLSGTLLCDKAEQLLEIFQAASDANDYKAAAPVYKTFWSRPNDIGQPTCDAIGDGRDLYLSLTGRYLKVANVLLANGERHDTYIAEAVYAVQNGKTAKGFAIVTTTTFQKIYKESDA